MFIKSSLTVLYVTRKGYQSVGSSGLLALKAYPISAASTLSGRSGRVANVAVSTLIPGIFATLTSASIVGILIVDQEGFFPRRDV